MLNEKRDGKMAKYRMTRVAAELDRVGDLIHKYAHRWGENPSTRMQLWVERYNELKNQLKRDNPAAWTAYCSERGYDPTHDGYDALA